MNRITRWLPAALVVAAALPALAGSPHKKCSMNTQDCLNAMSNQMKGSGWVGIEYDGEDAAAGYKIINVLPGSPAEKAGLVVGDVLWELEGVRMTPENGTALMKARKTWTPGQNVTYTVRRNGETKQITLTLASWPADVVARSIGQHMLDHVTADSATAKAN
jgi:C-terminal processing protease CtpA/Prc